MSDEVAIKNPGVRLEDTSRKFRRLADEWLRDRPRGVDVRQLVMQPAYQKIIGMGASAIPFLLDELEKRPDHWFWALYCITGIDPVPSKSQGKLKEMTGAWIAWGREHGYERTA